MRLCSVVDCKNKHEANGYCKSHWHKWKRYGNPLISKSILGRPRIHPFELKKPSVCCICGKRIRRKFNLCPIHRKNLLLFGSPYITYKKPFIIKPNKIRRCAISGCQNFAKKFMYCKTHLFYYRKYGEFHPNLCHCKQPVFMENLCKRHFLKKKKEIRYGRTDLFTSFNPESAYIFGYLLADGCLRTRSVHFLSIDKELVQKILTAMQIPLEDIRTRNAIASGKNKRKEAYYYEIKSKIIMAQLEKMGLIRKKANRLKLPQDLPEQFFFDFIRGFFDGDGCFYSTFQLFSMSYTFLEEIQRKLSQFSIPSKINSRIPSGGFSKSPNLFHTLNITKKANLIKLYPLLYPNEIVLCLERKRNKFAQYLKQRSKNPYRSKYQKQFGLPLIKIRSLLYLSQKKSLYLINHHPSKLTAFLNKELDLSSLKNLFPQFSNSKYSRLFGKPLALFLKERGFSHKTYQKISSSFSDFNDALKNNTDLTCSNLRILTILKHSCCISDCPYKEDPSLLPEKDKEFYFKFLKYEKYLNSVSF